MKNLWNKFINFLKKFWKVIVAIFGTIGGSLLLFKKKSPISNQIIKEQEQREKEQQQINNKVEKIKQEAKDLKDNYYKNKRMNK